MQFKNAFTSHQFSLLPSTLTPFEKFWTCASSEVKLNSEPVCRDFNQCMRRSYCCKRFCLDSFSNTPGCHHPINEYSYIVYNTELRSSHCDHLALNTPH